jgi:peptide deformylase
MILTHPNDFLRTKCAPVKLTPGAILKARTMLTTMEAEGGIGLAAPQIGWDARVFVIKAGIMAIAFNPLIVKTSVLNEVDVEGCLSLPGVMYEVVRPKTCLVEADWLFKDDIEGRKLKPRHLTVHFDGLNARCAQHELDHLDGIVIADKGKPVAAS